MGSLSDLTRDLDSMKLEFNYKKPKFMKDMGNGLKKKIQDNTPVDTGNLINSYEVQQRGDHVVVTTDVEYAPYVNDGHVAGSAFIQGKHMYELGLMQFESQADAMVDDLLKSIKGVGD